MSKNNKKQEMIKCNHAVKNQDGKCVLCDICPFYFLGDNVIDKCKRDKRLLLEDGELSDIYIQDFLKNNPQIQPRLIKDCNNCGHFILNKINQVKQLSENRINAYITEIKKNIITYNGSRVSFDVSSILQIAYIDKDDYIINLLSRSGSEDFILDTIYGSHQIADQLSTKHNVNLNYEQIKKSLETINFDQQQIDILGNLLTHEIGQDFSLRFATDPDILKSLVWDDDQPNRTRHLALVNTNYPRDDLINIIHNHYDLLTQIIASKIISNLPNAIDIIQNNKIPINSKIAILEHLSEDQYFDILRGSYAETLKIGALMYFDHEERLLHLIEIEKNNKLLLGYFIKLIQTYDYHEKYLDLAGEKLDINGLDILVNFIPKSNYEDFCLKPCLQNTIILKKMLPFIKDRKKLFQLRLSAPVSVQHLITERIKQLK